MLMKVLKMGPVYSTNSMFRFPRRYCDIREGGVRISGKYTACGLRDHVHNQEF
jgi:hypothetical protein